MTLSKANAGIERAGISALEKDRFYQRCMTKWLKGYSVHDIAFSEGAVTKTSVIQAINIKREELAESQKGEIEGIIAERIAGLKMIKKEAFDYIELFPEKVAQLLTVALRAEETQAKMQGVLSEKVLHLGRIEHTVKMYDFEDRTPGAIIIDSVVPRPNFTLQEETLPKIEEVVEIDEARMAVIIDPDSIHPSEVVVVEKKKAVLPPTIVNSILIMRPGDEEFD